MVLVTSDMEVYQSNDWGATWTAVTTSWPTPTILGSGDRSPTIPAGPKLWIDSFAASNGGIFKCSASDLASGTSSWTDVSQQPGSGSYSLAFASDTSVYISQVSLSGNGGTTWDPFGPWPWYGYGALLLDPNNPQTVYIADDAVGLEKTTDGGAHWDTKVQGLTALSLHLDGRLQGRSAAGLCDVRRPAGDLSQR